VELVHAKSSASLFLTGVAIACSTQRAFGRPGDRSSARRALVSKKVHSLGGVKRTRASRAIAPGVQPFGAGHRRREFRLQSLLRLFQGSGCWLPIELGANRLWRRQSRVRISRRLAYGGFELSYVFAAWTGLRNRHVAAERRANNQSRYYQKF
jgi:hypothetical protein